MKKFYVLLSNRYFATAWILSLLSLSSHSTTAQACLTAGTTSINSYPNTYYPAAQNYVTAGSTSIAIGTVKYGTTPISVGDVVLIIQMQGAQVNAVNSTNYGDNSGSGSGYLNNAALIAGTMEYAVAGNNVGLSGGTLNLTTGTTNAYQNTAYVTNGQYTFQVIRIPLYYNLQLTGTITAPAWDGAEGGVIMLFAENNINMNSQTVDASGLGFRGGGGRSLGGAGTGTSSDYYTLSSLNANGSKGEGIAGTPMYINNANTTLITTGAEGYPNGSYAMGAPGNAGGGGTDGDPASANDQNTGGGGGGNGGVGGYGGWAWSSSIQSGGRPGAVFSQVSPSRLVMGGGGGAGTSNNATGTPGNGLASSGSAGGGIIIIMAQNAILGNGTLKANGADANGTIQNDGGGGAGAGGSILIFSNNGITFGITAQAKGGAGGTNESTGGPSHGPGGGGGGGIVYSNATLSGSTKVTGGVAGTTNGTTTNFGATNGSAGVLTTNMIPALVVQPPTNCTVLAISFLDVTAVPDNGTVNVGWTVAPEVSTLNYVVERSTDGVNFSAIGSEPLKAANDVDNAYLYPDNGAYAVGGTIYYRIRQVENDGTFFYSKIVSVQLGGAASKLAVYPNPAQSFVTVSFSTTMAEAVSLRLFDVKGSQLWSKQYEAQQGQNTVNIDCVNTLAEGVYILQWSDGLRPEITKIVVRH
jgi:Secretion system C-terminal sorting domain